MTFAPPSNSSSKDQVWSPALSAGRGVDLSAWRNKTRAYCQPSVELRIWQVTNGLINIQVRNHGFSCRLKLSAALNFLDRPSGVESANRGRWDDPLNLDAAPHSQRAAKAGEGKRGTGDVVAARHMTILRIAGWQHPNFLLALPGGVAEDQPVQSTCLRKFREIVELLDFKFEFGSWGNPPISRPRKHEPGSFYPAMSRWVRRHQKSAACQSSAFSRASFTRFRVREVTGNSWQAAYGRSTMACYPPHVSKVASYPTEFVGNAALLEQDAVGWRWIISQKPQCFCDESVLRILEQAQNKMTLDYILSRRTNGANPFKILEALQSLPLDVKHSLPVILLRLPYHQFLETSYWFAISSAVKSRAQGRCQICNCTACLEAHHRTYKRLGWEVIDRMVDLVALCRNCHGLFHGHLPSQPEIATPTPVAASLPQQASVVKPKREKRPPKPASIKVDGRILQHDPVSIPEIDPIILTHELIDDCRANGSFTNATVKALHVPTPLRKGWVSDLLGMTVSREEYRQAKEGKYHYGTKLD